MIVKGLRSAADYDYELQMAQLNHAMTGVDTMFLPTRSENAFISSSWVKEIARLGGDVAAFVPPACSRAVTGKALRSPRIGRAAAELVM